MPSKLNVPEDMVESIGAFLKAESIPLSAATDTNAPVSVIKGEAGKKSIVSSLQAGGWIGCADARALADKLGIENRQVGKLMDHLEIKVRNCELGCF